MKKDNTTFPLIIIGALFFIFGFITWLNGTLIPFLKIACELNNFQALLVIFSFYISYFVMALPSSLLLYKTGFKNGISLGLAIIALGTLLFIPAAMTRNYMLFLIGLFVQGAGMALLQTAVNPYVTILGAFESAAKRISIMGICNKTAGALSPIILGAIVLQGAGVIVETLKTISGNEREILLNSLSNRIVTPYLVMSGILIVLALVMRFVNLPDVEAIVSDSIDVANDKKDYILKHPQLVLGFLSIFFYMGAEVIAGDTISLHGQAEGISLDTARMFTSLTLFSMITGYIIGIVTIPKYIKQERALAISAMLGIIFSVSAIATNGYVSVGFIALLGLANAIMWPAIWPLSLNGLGRLTKVGSSLLIMGIIGGAIFPLLYGKLADKVGNKDAYWILVPAYLFIAFYSVWGHKMRHK